jgi:hypothetical protein
MVQGINVEIDQLTVYGQNGPNPVLTQPLTPDQPSALTISLNSAAASANLNLPAHSALTRNAAADVWIVLSYHLQ